MSRARVLPQIVVAWVPVWALYTVLIISQHRPASWTSAALLGVVALVPAALLGMGVYALARRVPWPHPFRWRFALLHLVAAPTYAVVWMVLASVPQMLHFRRFVLAVGPGVVPFVALGVWLYVMVAGVSYSVEASSRAARAEAEAARTQLGALRAQLHPHFLFNALHTVVQLIPAHPERAAEAAELVASLLRTTIAEDRDLVALADEWAFVSRYLEIERIRFGDRLRVEAALDRDALDARVPSFALLTLVENAVRHGAAPRIDPTTIVVRAAREPGSGVRLAVQDDGAGAGAPPGDAGTGLTRLRARLRALYGAAARLETNAPDAGGFVATLVLPPASGDAAS